MREIKFRGREVDTGRIVYGYYLESATTSWIRDNEAKTYVQVEPESVAQLVGHDSQGREVYEGDKLADGDRIWTAEFLPLPTIDKLTLVEAK